MAESHLGQYLLLAKLIRVFAGFKALNLRLYTIMIDILDQNDIHSDKKYAQVCRIESEIQIIQI